MTLSPKPRSRPARRMLAGAALAGGLACGAVAVAGCGSATPTSQAADTQSATPPASPSSTSASPVMSTSPAGTSPSSPASSAASGSGRGSTGTAGCLSRYLRVSVGLSQGTAGSVYHALVFTNLASYSCTLYGYPGVSLGNGKPVRQVGAAATENPGTARELVTLAPGGTANATLQVVDAGNYSASQCGPEQTSWLQVYPPNQKQALYAQLSTTGCSKPVKLLTISAVRPGSGG